MYDKVAGIRLLNELIIIFRQGEVVQTLRRMAALDVLRFLHPALALPQWIQGLAIPIGAILIMISVIIVTIYQCADILHPEKAEKAEKAEIEEGGDA